MASSGTELMDLAIIISLVAVVLAVMVQTVSVVWFLSRLASRVEVLEKADEELRKERHPHRLAKIETLLEIIQRQSDDLSLKMDQVLAGQGHRTGPQR